MAQNYFKGKVTDDSGPIRMGRKKLKVTQTNLTLIGHFTNYRYNQSSFLFTKRDFEKKRYTLSVLIYLSI